MKAIFINHHISPDPKRNKQYNLFLKRGLEQEITVADIIQLGHQLMRQAKLHHHFFDNHTLLANAQYLTYHALQLPYPYGQTQTFTKNLTQKLTERDILTILALFEKRISERIPVEYITQEAWYLGNTFYVNEHVLVPRSIMNTRFQDFLLETLWHNHCVLDLCTGSGCIGITLALLNPKLNVDLVDISSAALEVATKNIQKYSLENRVNCLKSDLFQNVTHTYDLIITNPPYVASSEYQKSPAEFKNEPKMALESGKDGLDIIHLILKKAKNYLNPEGKIIAEVGVTAAKRLKKQYPQLPFTWYPYRKPTGKVSWFAMDCIFMLKAKDLKNL